MRQQLVDLLGRARLDAANAARRLEFARLRAMLLALSLAARAVEQCLETAVEADGEGDVGALGMSQGRKRGGQATHFGAKSLEMHEIDVGTRSPHRFRKMPRGQVARAVVEGREVAGCVAASHEPCDAEGALLHHFERQNDRWSFLGTRGDNERVGVGRLRPCRDPVGRLRRRHYLSRNQRRVITGCHNHALASGG